MLMASATCLPGVEHGVDVFFFGVKGVVDVLAGRWSWVLTFFLVSRASVTCLLGVVHGVEEFFAVVNGVGDVLAGRGAWWRRWTRWLTCPVLCTLGVMVQTVQFLDKVVAVPVVVAAGVHGPDVQKRLEVPQKQFCVLGRLWRCVWRWGD